MPIKTKKENVKDMNTVLVIGKGILLAYIISIMALIIYGILLTYTDISEVSMPTVTTIIMIISIAFSSIYVSMRVESKGWLNGAITGLIYMIILLLLGFILNIGISFDGYILFRLFMGFIIGTLAGILGINLK